MRSSYTATLDQPDCTFEKFLWRCAKAFSPLGHMRDDYMDAPPSEPPADDYNTTRLTKVQMDLAAILKKTPLDWSAIAEGQYKKDMEYYRSSLAEYEKTIKVFEKMRQRVVAWNPPTPDHNGLKVFMLDQLAASLEHTSPPQEPRLQNWEDLRNFEVKYCENNITYYQGKIEDNKKWREKCMKWVNDLKKSVPFPKE